MKKKILVLLTGALLMATVAACGKSSGSTEISVISREDGSGTRGAFTELTGIAKDDVDNTIDTAEVTNSTSVMITTVAGNESAIGYISLGSLNDSVKALKVDGAEATTENVKSGSYKLSRPFNIVTKEGLSDVAQDFIKYIMSVEGQKVIANDGYIAVETTDSYKASGLSGKVTLAGSTSVSPLMDVLADEYKKLNPDVTIEIQQTGSSAGVESTIEGTCDIGMASRELKDSEKSKGVTPTVIAMDGIAVIVNNDNDATEITSDQIMKIYTGEITDWSDISK